MRSVRLCALMLGLSWLVLGAPLASAQTDDAAEGRDIFVTNCASCHGADGAGTDRGPSLVGVGAASADFYLRTGRMPLANPDAQASHKDPAFPVEEIVAVVRYVDSLGEGPPIPAVDLEGADLSNGQSLFIENCAACHGATGAGGAVGENAFAPSLFAATPTEIAEAMIIGPGQMPAFNFIEEDRNDVVNYVVYLRTQPRPGGADIGGVGPVSEGWVAWIVGMGALTLVALFIGKSKSAPPGGEPS
ncbi:MAG: cytochrome bc1 complex diheme cytochrome c subunit [Actinomycetota bacterium]